MGGIVGIKTDLMHMPFIIQLTVMDMGFDRVKIGDIPFSDGHPTLFGPFPILNPVCFLMPGYSLLRHESMCTHCETSIIQIKNIGIRSQVDLLGEIDPHDTISALRQSKKFITSHCQTIPFVDQLTDIIIFRFVPPDIQIFYPEITD